MAGETAGRRRFAAEIALFCVYAMLTSCSRRDSSPPSQPEREPLGAAAIPLAPPAAPGPVQFVDVAKDRRLRFHHFSPLTEERHSHLVMGSGVGWLDFDRDGWPDLFCCQGAAFDPSGSGSPSGGAPRSTLFRNRGGQFAEVADAGIEMLAYAMGVAAADFDNDGFVDLCVTGYEENALFRNQGDGFFVRVPFPEQHRKGRWSASCAWGDVDGDGNLDLFVTNYANVPADDYPLCRHTAGGKTISIVCHPHKLPALTDVLYRNQGNGEFVDWSHEAGLDAAPAYHGLGVVAADLDQDGDIDLYVANDADPNQLWENRGEGRFVERGAISGAATNRHGEREAGMGLALGEFRGGGAFDLFVTNFYSETNTFYRNEGALLFSDVTEEIGLGAPSRLRLGFGASAADFDGDGWLDLFVANGHVHDRLPEVGRDEPFAQPPSLFRNDLGKRFVDLSANSGPWLREPHVARGSAVADFDRDGDPDIAVNCLNSPAALLQNETGGRRGWLRIELAGTPSNRSGVGALVQCDLAERTQVRCVQAGASYLSCDEEGVLFGLGPSQQAAKVTVTWPSGRRETWAGLAPNQTHRLIEGAGEELPRT